VSWLVGVVTVEMAAQNEVCLAASPSILTMDS
jgi:hypothetical protein